MVTQTSQVVKYFLFILRSSIYFSFCEVYYIDEVIKWETEFESLEKPKGLQ